MLHTKGYRWAPVALIFSLSGCANPDYTDFALLDGTGTVKIQISAHWPADAAADKLLNVVYELVVAHPAMTELNADVVLFPAGGLVDRYGHKVKGDVSCPSGECYRMGSLKFDSDRLREIRKYTTVDNYKWDCYVRPVEVYAKVLTGMEYGYLLERPRKSSYKFCDR